MKLPILILLLPLFTIAQPREKFWLKQSGAVVTSFAGGFFFRRAEILKDDWRRYKAVHTHTDPQWSNAKLSFKNKYKDWPRNQEPAFFGSTSFLVWTTDEFHLDNAIAAACVATNVGVTLTLYEKPNWKNILAQVSVTWIAHGCGRWAADKVYPKVN